MVLYIIKRPYQVLHNVWLYFIVKFNHYNKELLSTGSFSTFYNKTIYKKSVVIKKQVKCDGVIIDSDLISKCLFKLHHKNVIKYIATYTTNKFLYLAMENCDYSIEHYINQCKLNNVKRFSKTYCRLNEQTCDIVLQMAAAIQYIHSVDVIHTNITCKKFLIQFNANSKLIVKLTGFGFRNKLVQSEYFNKINGIYPISTAYITNWTPPEIFNNKTFTKKSDVWAFGCVFCCIITYNTQLVNSDNVNEIHSLRNVLNTNITNMIECMVSINPDNRPLINVNQINIALNS